MGGTLLLLDMWVDVIERETTVTDRLQEVYEPLETIAFWSSIAFPVGYVPFLLGGIASPERALAFVGLVVVHVLLLTVGHAHGRA